MDEDEKPVVPVEPVRFAPKETVAVPEPTPLPDPRVEPTTPSPHSVMTETELPGGFSVSPPSPTTTAPSTKPPFFKFFITVGIIFAVGVYGMVAYLYLGNQDLKRKVEENKPKLAVSTSTPLAPKLDYQIANGSVVSVDESGKTEILVNKSDYPKTGITGFAKVKQSPNKNYLCFESWPPASEPSLYYSKVNGSEVVSVGPNFKSCTWSNKSEKIAFVNYQSSEKPVDIFVYDLASLEQTNLTKASTTSATLRFYEIVGWSPDDSKITCNYQDVDSKNTAKEILGECEVNASTGVATELKQSPTTTPTNTSNEPG